MWVFNNYFRILKEKIYYMLKEIFLILITILCMGIITFLPSLSFLKMGILIFFVIAQLAIVYKYYGNILKKYYDKDFMQQKLIIYFVIKFIFGMNVSIINLVIPFSYLLFLLYMNYYLISNVLEVQGIKSQFIVYIIYTTISVAKTIIDVVLGLSFILGIMLSLIIHSLEGSFLTLILFLVINFLVSPLMDTIHINIAKHFNDSKDDGGEKIVYPPAKYEKVHTYMVNNGFSESSYFLLQEKSLTDEKVNKVLNIIESQQEKDENYIYTNREKINNILKNLIASNIS